MELKGKRVAILLENKYNEFEFWYPYFRMKEAGAQVTIVGTGAREYVGSNGLPAPHPGVRESLEELLSVEEVKPEIFDGVIIPGGFAPDYMRRNQSILQLVRDIYSAGKVVAAICHAGWVLVSAGILKGRKATCFFAIKDDVVNAGASYVDSSVVKDGNLITSRWPDDLPEFCRAVIEALRKA
ncbi:MAG: type 1 glutamine amidotransferase domain-containing protein [Thermodesulfobacteriota bacterium]